MLWTFDQFLKIYNMLIQTYNIYIVIYVSGWSDCCYNTFHVKLIWPFCSTYYLACRNIWWKNNLHGGGFKLFESPMHCTMSDAWGTCYPLLSDCNNLEQLWIFRTSREVTCLCVVQPNPHLCWPPSSTTAKNNVVQVLEDRPSQ